MGGWLVGEDEAGLRVGGTARQGQPQTLAPGVAGAIVLAFGYAALFPVGIVLSLLGAFAVWPIKAVR